MFPTIEATPGINNDDDFNPDVQTHVHEETYTNQSGIEINKPVDGAYSPDRWAEMLGYTLKNILWRCTLCNLDNRPKLNAKRECGCCTKLFRMRNWRPVACPAAPLCLPPREYLTSPPRGWPPCGGWKRHTGI